MAGARSPPSTPTFSRSNSPQPADAPVAKHKLDKVMRLPGFAFSKKHLFQPRNRDSIYRTTGAITTTGREGRQPTVLRRIIIIYRNAIQTSRLFPSYNIETHHFWAAVLSDVRKETPQMTADLSVAAMMDIVSVYTQAWADAQDGAEDQEGVSSGEETELDVTKPFKPSTDPRKILLPLVRAWARAFRKHKASTPRKTPTPEPAAEPAAQPAPVTAYHARVPEETDAEYISRLQKTIESMAADNAALKEQQEVSDELNEDRLDRLNATLERTESKLREAESQLRLAKLGVGGEEDDPWVSWKMYEAQLDIPGGKSDGGEDEHGEGDLLL